MAGRSVSTSHGGRRLFPRRPIAPLVGLLTLCSCLAVTAQRPERERSVRLPDGTTVLEAGWQLVLAAENSCVYVVPDSWPVSHDGRQAAAPDLAVSVRLVATQDDWQAHRAKIRALMSPALVHTDSSDRLWMEQSDGQRTWHHLSVTNGSDVCALDLEARGTPPAGVVQRIVSSVRTATSADRDWLKR